MTPSTRLATLVLAISWLPCALAADTGSDPTDAERRLQATFDRTIDAEEIERALDAALERKLEVKLDELRVQEYRRMAHQLEAYFAGRSEELISEVRRQMEQASARRQYEEAARQRDRLFALKRTVERQHVVKAFVGP